MSTGKEYEKLLEKMYRDLEPNAEIKHDDHIYDERAKINRQIDVSIKYKFAGVDHLIIVEAKDYKHNADVSVVDQFAKVIEDLNANKGILICSKGFSKAALDKAKSYGIECLTVHSALNKKWETLLKIPVLRTVHYFNLDSEIKIDIAHKAGKEVTIMGSVLSYDGINLIELTDVIQDQIFNKMGWEYIKTSKKIRIDLKKIGLYHEFDKEMLPVYEGYIEIEYLKTEKQNFHIDPIDYIYTSDHIKNEKKLHNLTINDEILKDVFYNDHVHDKGITDQPIISAVIYNYNDGNAIKANLKCKVKGGIEGVFFIRDKTIFFDNEMNREITNFEQFLKGNA